jgi:hypothetical protein
LSSHVSPPLHRYVALKAWFLPIMQKGSVILLYMNIVQTVKEVFFFGFVYKLI